ncbi:MAG: hypothetical protein ACKV2O_23870 [Acidimicrobiales bacterium]
MGLWRRRSLALDGGPPTETQHVLWLQAGEGFADMRVPLEDTDPQPMSAPLSFAGVTTWDGTALCWHRDLDLHQVIEADEGSITWDGEDLIETGIFTFGGQPTPYVEVWRREAGATTPRLSMRTLD